MKKRILSLLLVLVMCLSLSPFLEVSAAVNTKEVTKTSDGLNENDTELNLSNWALGDLMTGDTYGIYPLSWYNLDMKAPISQGKLLKLIAGMRYKILETGSVTKNPDIIYKTKKNMTVKEVLNTYYTLLTTMEYSSDLGLSTTSPIDKLKAIGVYTGAKGEPTLKDICSLEEACVYASRIITYVYDKLDAASKGFLWVAKKGENTIYMLGSIHMASTEIYPFSKDILDAYQSSDALVVELNAFDTKGSMNIAKLGMYSDGTKLKDHVSSDTYQKVITLAAKYEYSEAIISLFKPWYIDLLFSSLTYTDNGEEAQASEAANLGIDMNFLSNATYYGKTILEVEGYEYQGKMLDSFSDELEELLLNSTMDSLNSTLNGEENYNDEMLDYMLELWHEGDVDTFLEYFTSNDSDTTNLSEKEKSLVEEYNYKLMTQRDIGMANYIDNLLKGEGSSTYFVVVGSAHYISDHSVLDLLKEKGYEISQIK